MWGRNTSRLNIYTRYELKKFDNTNSILLHTVLNKKARRAHKERTAYNSHDTLIYSEWHGEYRRRRTCSTAGVNIQRDEIHWTDYQINAMCHNLTGVGCC